MDLSSCKIDNEYYFEDIFILVGSTMFKVPKHHFELTSNIFRDMFRLPVAHDSSPDGKTKEKPLHLTSIDEEDFRQLLRVLYPRNFNKEKFTVAQWSSVLKLATMWEFKEVRLTAIRQLDSLSVDGVTLLALARDYDVKHWWAKALRMLAKKEPLADEDIQRVGVSLGMKVILLQGHVKGYEETMVKQSTPKKAKGARSRSPSPARARKEPAPASPPKEDPVSVIDAFIRKIFPEVVFPSPWGGWSGVAKDPHAYYTPEWGQSD